jgi:hypothetical protein
LNRHNVKKMTPKEFRESGYLQELNRLFLHPLGLAMEVTINDDGTEFFSGVWDCRDDPEGIVYSPDGSTKRRGRSRKSVSNASDTSSNLPDVGELTLEDIEAEIGHTLDKLERLRALYAAVQGQEHRRVAKLIAEFQAEKAKEKDHA